MLWCQWFLLLESLIQCLFLSLLCQLCWPNPLPCTIRSYIKSLTVKRSVQNHAVFNLGEKRNHPRPQGSTPSLAPSNRDQPMKFLLRYDRNSQWACYWTLGNLQLCNLDGQFIPASCAFVSYCHHLINVYKELSGKYDVFLYSYCYTYTVYYSSIHSSTTLKSTE